MKKLWSTIVGTLLLSSVLLTACGNSQTAGNVDQTKQINFGATAGPFTDMVKNGIAPLLEKKGYTVKVTEFSDYIQPNLTLAEGSIDANLFQNEIYLKKFSTDKNLDLTGIIKVPTGPMGIYSKKYKSIEEVPDGASVSIPNDPTNLARALIVLQQAGLITVNKDADPIKVSEKDIVENKKHLVITPVEAAQLPRAVDSQDLSLVPGNFALAAKMDLKSALVLENMPEHYLNLVAVRTADKDKQFVKDIKEVIESPEFEAFIDKEFSSFFKPQWMKK
jgi:D-methionine transport system substrate-binding protein